MATLIENGYPIFTDANGDPLESGYIFIGVAGLNPLSNPLQAYWDTDLTIPASNIRTDGGYPAYNGSPGRLYISDNYSIVVKDKVGKVVYTTLSALNYFVGTAESPGIDTSKVVAKDADEVTVKAGSYADINGTFVSVSVDTDLVIGSIATDYYIKLTADSAVTIQTYAGAYSVEKAGIYDGVDRILNWKLSRDASQVFISRIVDPAQGLTTDVNLVDIQTNTANIAVNVTDIATNAADILTNAIDTAAAIVAEATTRSNTDTALAADTTALDGEVTALDGRTTVLEGSGAIQGVGTTNDVVHNSVSTDGTALKTKVIEIGVWDMSATTELIVSTGITGMTTLDIVQIDILIRDDLTTATGIFSFCGANSSTNLSDGYYIATINTVLLRRTVGGHFDSSTFNSTAFSRGKITITYKA